MEMLQGGVENSWASGPGEGVLLTPDDASRILRIAVRTLEKWRSEGRGPPWVRMGRRVVYRREAVLDFVRDQETKGKTEAIPKQMEVTSRPYWKDRNRQHVDITFAHPRTQRPFRKRIVAPAGMGEEAAQEWGRGQAMRLFMAQCKAPEEVDGRQDGVGTTKEKIALEPAGLTAPILTEFWAVFTARYVAGLKHSTRLGFEESWRNHIRDLLGGRRLDELDQAAFESLQVSLEAKGLLVESQKHIMRKLTRCLTWAVQHQYVKAEIPKLHFAKQRKSRLPTYSREQWEAFVQCASTRPSDRVLALLLSDGILRIGEVAGLQWRDIDVEQGLMRIARNICKEVVQDSPKGEIGDVPLSPRLGAALQELRRIQGVGPWVLGREVDGVPTFSSDNVLRLRVRRLQERARIPAWGAHRVRHSVLTFLAENGVTPYALQAFARHEDMATTMRYYVHLDRLKLAREAVSVLVGATAPRAT